jgi:hypothetical protein
MIKLSLIAVLLVGTAGAPLGHATEISSTPATVLLELFTSEGSSSCPPADRLLETLDRTHSIAGAEVIVLSEHVDYWDRLGWRDPFSSPQYSGRQYDYSHKFRLDGVYTPQLVVDGRIQLVGSDRSGAMAAIDRARHEQKIVVAISNVARTGTQVTARIELAAKQPQIKARTAALYVALADNSDESQVARGENAGRALTHVAVVRSLTQIGTIGLDSPFAKDVTVSSQPGVGTNGLRMVAFLQDTVSGQILGAALQKLQ